jgi:hypothetical protein
MQLGEPRVRDINAAVFDPDRLARIYRVGEWIDLDAEAPPPIDDLAGTKATEGTDG